MKLNFKKFRLKVLVETKCESKCWSKTTCRKVMIKLHLIKIFTLKKKKETLWVTFWVAFIVWCRHNYDGCRRTNEKHWQVERKEEGKKINYSWRKRNSLKVFSVESRVIWMWVRWLGNLSSRLSRLRRRPCPNVLIHRLSPAQKKPIKIKEQKKKQLNNKSDDCREVKVFDKNCQLL